MSKSQILHKAVKLRSIEREDNDARTAGGSLGKTESNEDPIP
jgi:hypothetical protein